MLGKGLSHAEKIIKSEDFNMPAMPLPDEELDMTVVECRWDRIKPPVTNDEVVSLLVVAHG